MSDRAERDYSGRSLFDKLGVVADARVALVGPHDDCFTTDLNARLAKAASQALRTRYAIIFVRVDRARISRASSARLPHLEANGSLWVFHPKGRGASPTDAEVRSAGLAAGLVDNKISAYTDSHTATRFVIPLARR